VFDLLVLGGLGVDIRVRVPALPVPLADSVIVPPIDLRVGNTGAGVALAAHAIGLDVMVVDVLGEDAAGDVVRGALARAASASSTRLTTVLRDDPRGTRRSVNLVDQEGRRMSLYDPRGPAVAPPAFAAADIAALVADARHVHVSIMDWMRGLMPAVQGAARANGIAISTDLHDWDGENEYHQAFAVAADWVFVSDVKLGQVGTSGAHAEAALPGRIRVITSGARGASVAEPGGVTARIPAAMPPGPVIDTNGAGDALVAGFVAARLHGHSTVESAHYGARVAAAACTWDGMEYPPGLLPLPI
jgi:sugar/nucleoside kinase (ribokinase family)